MHSSNFQRFQRTPGGLGGSGASGSSSASAIHEYNEGRSYFSDKSSDSEGDKRRKSKKRKKSRSAIGLNPAKKARKEKKKEWTTTISEIDISSDEEVEADESDDEKEPKEQKNETIDVRPMDSDGNTIDLEEKKTDDVPSSATISSEDKTTMDAKKSSPAVDATIPASPLSHSTSAPSSSTRGPSASSSTPSAIPRSVPSPINPSNSRFGISEPTSVSLFEETWPDRSPADDYCFLCERKDHPDKLLTNRYYQCLEKLVSQYGTMSTLVLCKIIQRYYKQVFQPHQPLQRDWTLNSIRKHIEEDGASNEAMLRNVTRIVHKEINILANTGLALYCPDTGKIYANSRGSGNLTKLTRTLLSCIRGGR